MARMMHRTRRPAIFDATPTPPFPSASASCIKRATHPSATMPANELLRLIPRDESTPVHLVARAQFRIGRSPHHSDWVARFQPETPENEILTNELGRVHVVGEIVGGQPVLRDGNGTEASINGTTFDGAPLPANAGAAVRRRAMLTLGELFVVDVVPLFAKADDFSVEGYSDSGDVQGAIIFAPRRLEATLCDAVWIFTRLDFALRPGGGPAWLAPRRGNPAAFIRRDGRFWLANTSLESDALQLDGETVTVGEAVALADGETLRLGALEYAIEIE